MNLANNVKNLKAKTEKEILHLTILKKRQEYSPYGLGITLNILREIVSEMDLILANLEQEDV